MVAETSQYRTNIILRISNHFCNSFYGTSGIYRYTGNRLWSYVRGKASRQVVSLKQTFQSLELVANFTTPLCMVRETLQHLWLGFHMTRTTSCVGSHIRMDLVRSIRTSNEFHSVSSTKIHALCILSSDLDGIGVLICRWAITFSLLPLDADTYMQWRKS